MMCVLTYGRMYVCMYVGGEPEEGEEDDDEGGDEEVGRSSCSVRMMMMMMMMMMIGRPQLYTYLPTYLPVLT